MKLKAPKPWQIVIIFVSIILLAVGGGILYAYFSTDGFKEKPVYPAITVSDKNQIYNNDRGQYEADSDFSLEFTTTTEGVNRKNITLSFPSGIAFERNEEDGTISDGVIIVPEKISLEEEFKVVLVKDAYDPTTFELIEGDNIPEDAVYVNRGGVSDLIITPEDNKDYNSQIKIAVDVPVLKINLTLKDATTGLEFGADNGIVKIPENTNFVVETDFIPKASRYQFSDEKNSAVAEENRKEKTVYLHTDATGIVMNYVDKSDIYFSALDQVSSENIIDAYAFKSAKDEKVFVSENFGLEEKALYNQAISVLSSPNANSVKANISPAVVEANVSSFSVNTNSEDSPYPLEVSKVFKIVAGPGSAVSGALNIQVRNEHQEILSGLIKNVAARISSITGADGVVLTDANRIANYATLRGAGNVEIDGTEYTYINSSVRDLNLANFEISALQPCSIQIEVVLVLQDEFENYHIFNPESKHLLYANATEQPDDVVSWSDTWLDKSGINLKIIYSGGQVVPTEYEQNLSDVAVVPPTNTYQRKVFFIYYEGNEQSKNIVSTTSIGEGAYYVNGTLLKLYPLNGSELVVNGSGKCKLIFATVRTDAYGEPIMSTDNTDKNKIYNLVQVSDPVDVEVENSLRGISELNGVVTDPELFDNESNQFAIPTAKDNVITLQIGLEVGDAEIFLEEYSKGRISLFATTTSDGSGEKLNNVFVFEVQEDDIQKNTDKEIVKVKVSTNPTLAISEEKGISYYIHIEYNNSVTTELTSAEIYSGTVSESNKVGSAIIVYNQITKELESDLIDAVFDVKQMLQYDGTSDIQIFTQGGEKGIGLTDFNNLLRQIIRKDAFGRQFEASYTVSSSQPNLVIVNQENEISFGNGEGNNIIITISSGDATESFTMNVEVVGLSEITVNGIPAQNLGSVYYEPESTDIQPGQNIYFRTVGENEGILKLFVGENEEYYSNKYYIKFNDTYLASYDDSLWKLIDVYDKNGDSIGNNHSSLSQQDIYGIGIKGHLGSDVTLVFNAYNDNKTVNFTFTVTIKATATLTKNSLNYVKYGEEMFGVSQHDDSSRTGVYAGFGINLNDDNLYADNYLQVENVNWGSVYAGYNYIYLNSSGNAEIYAQEQSNGNNGKLIGKINNGVIIFEDVTVATEYNITLFAINEEGAFGKHVGNQYGFNITIPFTVYPNITIVYPNTTIVYPNTTISDTNGSTIKLSDLISEEGYSWTNVFELARITKILQAGDSCIGNSTIPPDDLYSCGISSYEFSNYVEINTTNDTIILKNAPTFARGETSKKITLTAFDAERNIVATKEFELELGVLLGDLAAQDTDGKYLITSDYSLSTSEIKAVRKNDDYDVILLAPNTSSLYVNSKFKVNGFDIQLQKHLESSATAFYTFSNTTADYTSITLKSSGAITNQSNTYLLLYFNYNSTTYAVWQVPVVYSLIGSQLPSIDCSNEEKLSDVFGNGLDKDVTAGKTYKLVKDNEASSDEKCYIFEKTDDSIGLEFAIVDSIGGQTISNLSDTPVVSIDNSGRLVLKNVENGIETSVVIKITISKGAYSHDFYLTLNVIPNAKLQPVIYPGGEGASAEFVQSNDSQGETVITLDAPHEITGQSRFPDTAVDLKTTASPISLSDGKYSISEVTIAGEEVTDYSEFVRLENNTKLVFSNSASNLTVKIIKQYSNYYGAVAEYTFIFNSTNIEYSLRFTPGESQDKITGNDESGYLLTLSKQSGKHTITVQPTQKDETGATSDVETTVEIISFVDSNGDIIAEWGNSISGWDVPSLTDKTLTITIPDFVSEDTNFGINFLIAGEQYVKLRVFVPATVTVTWQTEPLSGGMQYSLLQGEETNWFAEIPTDGSISNITITSDKSFIIPNNGSRTITVLPIYKEPQSATITISYTYDGKPGSASKTLEFQPNLRVEDYEDNSPIVSGTTRKININKILIDNGTVTQLNGYSLQETSYTQGLIQRVEIWKNNEQAYIKITPKDVAQTTSTWIEFKLKFGDPNGYYFETDVIRISFVIKPAVIPTVTYPSPAGENEKLEYESISLQNATFNDVVEFIRSTAPFADSPRVDFKLVEATDGDETPAVSEYATQTINLKTPIPTGVTLTGDVFSADAGVVPSGTAVTFEISYRGVVAEYKIYLFEKAITSTINSTINQVTNTKKPYEKIYADQGDVYIGEKLTPVDNKIIINEDEYSFEYKLSFNTILDEPNGNVVIGGKTYAYEYDRSTNTLTLSLVYEGTEGSITADGQEINYSYTEDRNLVIENGEFEVTAGYIKIGDKTYAYECDTSAGKLTLSLVYVGNRNNGLITVDGQEINYYYDGSQLVIENGVFEITTGNVEINGKTYAYEYDASAEKLTLSLVYVGNGNNGLITVDGQEINYSYKEEQLYFNETPVTTVGKVKTGRNTYNYQYDTSAGKLTLSLVYEGTEGSITADGEEISYSYANNQLSFNTADYIVITGNVKINGSTYAYKYDGSTNTLTLSLVYEGEGGSITVGEQEISYSYANNQLSFNTADNTVITGNVKINGKTYAYEYDTSAGKLTLTLVYEGEGGLITVGGKEISYSYEENKLTIKNNIEFKGLAGNVEINGKTYAYEYDPSAEKLTLTLVYEGEGGLITVGEEEISYNYDSSLGELTIKNETFTGLAGIVEINGKTYAYEYDPSAEKLTLTLVYNGTDGSITVGGQGINYNYDSSSGVLTINNETFTELAGNVVIGGKTYAYEYDTSAGKLTLTLVYEGEGGSINLDGMEYSYTTSLELLKLNSAGEKYIGTGGTISIGNDKYYYGYSNNKLTLSPTTNIFAKNRLLQLSVSSSARVGSVYKIYAVADNDPSQFKLLASFQLTSAHIASGLIYIDIGILSNIKIGSTAIANNDNLLNSDYYFAFGSESNSGFVPSINPGVSILRQASRVEYYYTLADGSTVLIVDNSLKIIETEIDENDAPVTSTTASKFDNGDLATFKITYDIDGVASKGGVTLRAKKSLDIQVGRAWTEGNKEVIEIQTNWLNHYKLVEQAEIIHPSTGEYISASSIMSGNAKLELEIIDPNQFVSIGFDRGNIDLSEFKYLTSDEKDYLTYTPIKDNENDLVYDFYLSAEGADNNGDYILLKFTYSSGDMEQSFFIVLKLIPAYDVKIGNVQVATAGEISSSNSNISAPYDFITDQDDKAMVVASMGSDSIISFVRRNSEDKSNIATSLTYEIEVSDSGEYNSPENVGNLKYNDTNSWSKEPENNELKDGDVLTYNGTPSADLKFTPTKVIFGQRKYKVTIRNIWGFEVEFYFTVSPEVLQNPVVTNLSETQFTEGESFDIGVLYDVFTVSKSDDDKYSILRQVDQMPVPATELDLGLVILDNIDTWIFKGNTIPGGSNFVPGISNEYYNNYYSKQNDQTYKFVTIETVSFQFGDEGPISVDAIAGNNNGKKLATETHESDYRAPLRNFTVPNMPGWYYGNNNAINAKMIINLKYSKTTVTETGAKTETETCSVTYNVQISRNIKIESTKNVVIDSESFELSNYIKISKSGVELAGGAYYDDTLEVTLPIGAEATIELTVNRSGQSTTKSLTLTNKNQIRKVTFYQSMSDIIGFTLQPDTDTVTIKVVPSNDNTVVRYAGRDISAQTKDDEGYTIGKTGSENSTSWRAKSDDTLYIENSGRFGILDNSYISVTKSYIVGVNTASSAVPNMKYYRFNKNYLITSKYYSFDNGLGQEDLKRINVSAVTKTDDGGYIMPIDVWASGMKIYQAGEDENNRPTSGGTEINFADLFNKVFKKNAIISLNELGLSDKFLYTQNESATPNKMLYHLTDAKTSEGDEGSVLLDINGVIYSFTKDESGNIYHKKSGEEGGPTEVEFENESDAAVITLEGQEFVIEKSDETVAIIYQVEEVSISNDTAYYISGNTTIHFDLGGEQPYCYIYKIDDSSPIYFEVRVGEGLVSTAYFEGTDLHTGAGYTPSSGEYISVVIKVKASGGATNSFENKDDYDKVLSTFRIILVRDSSPST